MSRPGDWNCKSCQHLNFGWRDLCQKCGGTLNGKGSTFVFSTPGALPGDWYCKSRNCGALNYAKRSKCFKCSILKDESDGVYEGVMPCPGGFVDRPGFKSGDWICAWSAKEDNLKGEHLL
ncbi:hypothetical protein GIB67_021371 [Kingdonia uniflora]|uniref:RanBP2-type domain-containing protein n=1 Tax=Kingdonia uniflora TaxID=39325 RepID=A0A7J7MCV9_9MAGN|nr:hypothetical protein GIB67_021371 [Kingdonia uniflora]